MNRDPVILLVEDNPDDVDLTVRALERSRVANRIVVARDGVDALEYLFGEGEHAARDVSHQPQVVLLDLKLPRLDGHRVLESIRKDPRTRMLPVVVLTSSDDERDVLESYALGANSYVRKPVDFERFLDAARQLGLYWLVLNLAPPSHRP